MSAGRGSRQCRALWDSQRDCGDKHYKRHIVLSHSTEIDDQLGRRKPRNKYKSKDVDLHLYPGALWIFCRNIWYCNAMQAGGTNHTAPLGPVYPGLWWGLWSRVLASFSEHPQGLFCASKREKQMERPATPLLLLLFLHPVSIFISSHNLFQIQHMVIWGSTKSKILFSNQELLFWLILFRQTFHLSGFQWLSMSFELRHGYCVIDKLLPRLDPIRRSSPAPPSRPNKVTPGLHMEPRQAAFSFFL